MTRRLRREWPLVAARADLTVALAATRALPPVERKKK